MKIIQNDFCVINEKSKKNNGLFVCRIPMTFNVIVRLTTYMYDGFISQEVLKYIFFRNIMNKFLKFILMIMNE